MKFMGEVVETNRYVWGKFRVEFTYREGRLDAVKMQNDELGRVGNIRLDAHEAREVLSIFKDELRSWPNIANTRIRDLREVDDDE